MFAEIVDELAGQAIGGEITDDATEVDLLRGCRGGGL